jgi:hypothetical protein
MWNKKEHHKFSGTKQTYLNGTIDIYWEQKVQSFLMEGTQIICLGTKKNITNFLEQN